MMQVINKWFGTREKGLPLFNAYDLMLIIFIYDLMLEDKNLIIYQSIIILFLDLIKVTLSSIDDLKFINNS